MHVMAGVKYKIMLPIPSRSSEKKNPFLGNRSVFPSSIRAHASNSRVIRARARNWITSSAEHPPLSPHCDVGDIKEMIPFP